MYKLNSKNFSALVLLNRKYSSRINRVSSQRKTFTSVRHHYPGVDKMSILRYFKRQIPTPEAAGIDSKETEAANKDVEELQIVIQKRKQYSISQIMNQIIDFAIKSQIIKSCIRDFFSILGILTKL